MSLFLELPLSQKYHAIAHFYCKINYTPFFIGKYVKYTYTYYVANSEAKYILKYT